MSNYSLVVNSTFQPFTYQELAAPLDRQELYHEKIADEYDKLSSQADVLEAMGANDRDKNSKTYLKYKNYSDNLRKEADNLYQNGLNYDTRQRLSNLRRMYNTDIVPIQNAWNKREQEADIQMKASLQNPSLMFTRDARNSTLDEYIANPTGGFGVINGNNITAQMASMANNLKEQIRKGDKTNIDDYTYNYIVQHGLDENIIRDWRNNPTLSKMFEQVMRANGVTPEALNGSANAQNIINQSTGYAEMGMWNAIGKDTNSIVENFKARQDYQFELSEKAADAALQRQAALEAVKNNGGIGGVPTITSDGVGLETTENYTAKGKSEIEKLKAGNDGLKASYFGKELGSVNPMAIYEEYQEERKKHTKQVSKKQDVNNPYAATPQRINVKTTVPDDEAARKAVLEKYKKYGVTDILSEEQYKLLSDMGYSKTNNPGNAKSKYSTFESGFNNLVTKKNRYSVNMTKYDSVDDRIRGRATELENYGQMAGNIFEVGKDGKKGRGVTKVKELFGSDDKIKVNGVYYDPQFKGSIVFRTSEGKRYVASPEILGNEFKGLINDLESDPRMTPKHIAAALYEALNSMNKVQSETDSKV